MCPEEKGEFTRKSSMLYHIQVHFDVAIYTCEICQEKKMKNFAFRHNAHYKEHMENQHGRGNMPNYERQTSDDLIVKYAFEKFNQLGRKEEIAVTKAVVQEVRKYAVTLLFQLSRWKQFVKWDVTIFQKSMKFPIWKMGKVRV